MATEIRACQGGDTLTVIRPFTHGLEFEKCQACKIAVAWDKINDELYGFKTVCREKK